MNNIIKSVEGAKNLLVAIGKVLSEHSSSIYLVTALATGTATVVTACKATIDVQPAIEEARACIADINEHAEEDEEYAANKKKADLRKVKIDLVKTVGKEYAGSIALGFATGTLVYMSHNSQKMEIKELKKTVASVTTAWMNEHKSFDMYRANVIKDLGAEKDKEYRYGIEEIEEEVKTTTKSGKEKTEKVRRKVLTSDLPPLTRCIAEDSCGLIVHDMSGLHVDHESLDRLFRGSECKPLQDIAGELIPDGNTGILMMLKHIEDFLNDFARINGGFTVEKVDDILKMDINYGSDEAEFNALAGYIYDPNKPFSFNIYDIKDKDKRDFINGWEHRLFIEIPINSVNIRKDLRLMNEEYYRTRRGITA